MYTYHVLITSHMLPLNRFQLQVGLSALFLKEIGYETKDFRFQMIKC